MEIRIHIPRPMFWMTIVAALVLWGTGIIEIHWPGQSLRGELVGGERPASAIADARRDINRQQVTQAVLSQREEIYRYNVEVLERAALETKTPEDIEKLKNARSVLLSIIRERDQSEKLLLLSLQQLWEAEGTAYRTEAAIGDRVLLWPVEPSLGLSATFEDAGYEQRFGFPHHAIDIPVPQGTAIKAPAGGTVLKVALNGLGYSFIVLEHENGLQSVFGHIIDATVQIGDRVGVGQIIGHSGGEPGTMGAGPLTTGAHLHFAIRKDGVLVNPMEYLPSISSYPL